MKKILVPTDFSESATNAAAYALQLARYLKADIELCHAFMVPSEAGVAGQMVWPVYEYDELKKETLSQMDSIIRQLEAESELTVSKYTFGPKIEKTSEAGFATDLVIKLSEEKQVCLVVMGMSGAGSIPKLILGSTSRNMIERAAFPVLLIPAELVFKEIKKIGFATDLSSGDIDAIHSLAGFARYFDAELVIVHVGSGEREYQRKTELFLSDITSKINYNKIYFRHVINDDINEGLDWLGDYGRIDMMVMVHRQRTLIDRIFNGSFTKKQAGHIHIPLLVIPEGVNKVF